MSAHIAYQYDVGSWGCQGTLRVTDPCYSRQDGLQVSGIEKRPLAGTCAVKPGLWGGCVVTDTRHQVNLRLVAWTGPDPMPELPSTDKLAATPGWEQLGFFAGVDSGQCGIFDDAGYPEEPEAVQPDGTTFYDRVLGVTEHKDFGTIVWGATAAPVGVVSHSGMGDGLYDVYAHRDSSGAINVILVDFIAEDDLDALCGDGDENGDDDECGDDENGDERVNETGDQAEADGDEYYVGESDSDERELLADDDEDAKKKSDAPPRSPGDASV